MKELDHLRLRLKQKMPFLAKTYQVESLGIFGSFVRKEQNAQSDLDLLVTFTETPSLLRLIELEYYLGDLLGVRVDLVMKDSLKPRVSDRVLTEVLAV
ncbi:MAG: nucleotidyltransferase family protein [Chloroflexi bacterium]|jgi:predicted nucleotidyltransferase|nr:nucleotidyltransferase family protein [Chloroflexota bacterium]